MNKAGTIKYQAIILTLARLIEALVQLFIPIVLIRFISTDAFGMYRFLWLVVNTIMILAPLGMPLSLLYFFPNLDDKGKSRYLYQTLSFLFCSGLLFSLIISPINVILPENLTNLLNNNEIAIPVFIFFWVFTHAIDVVPNAMQDNISQALITIGLTLARSALIIWTAVYYGDFYHIVLSLVVFSLVRCLTLFAYISYKFDLKAGVFDSESFNRQFKYSYPFGISGLVYSLRKQSEQWIVAFFFAPSLFGAFSLATMIILPFDIIRSSISNVILPRMSHAFSQGRLDQSIHYNKSFNLIVNAICFPLLAFIYLNCEDIVTLLFGAEYMSAVTVMRVYLIQLFLTVEIGNIMRILELGRASFKYNAYVLTVSVPLSFYLSQEIGLYGAAIGGLTGGILVLLMELTRITKTIKTSVKSLIYWGDWALLLALAWTSIYLSLTLYQETGHDLAIYLKLISLFSLQAVIYASLLFVTGELKRIKRLSTIGTI